MNTQNFIAKDRKLLPAQDFEFLRSSGMKYIEKYGNQFWTDYNPHDPGVTILEILSYAITELGYRTNFDIKDILTNKTGKIENKTFFPADEIFTNAPLTEIDYRKLLIDIEGVSNAWFLATQKILKDSNGFYLPNIAEKPIYVNEFEDKLSLKNTDSLKRTLPKKISIRGLNKVILELNDDPLLGDLNSTQIDYEFLIDNVWLQVNITPKFDSWNDTIAVSFLEIDFKKLSNYDAIKYTENNQQVGVEISFLNNKERIVFLVKPYSSKEIDQLNKFFNKKASLFIANINEIIKLFTAKVKKVKKVFDEVNFKLQSNRNLTEDYLSIETIKSTQIGICAKIEIEPQTNIVDLMAQIQIAIHNLISPQVAFYTLSQMINEGYHTEDIFTGPLLNHGFLKEEEIIKTQLPDAIHSSDIIAVVMKIKGVVSISEVLLTEYGNDGNALEGNSNKAWSLKLTGRDRKSVV